MLQQRVFRRLFTEQVRGPEEEVDLALAALYVAGEEYPELDVDACIGALDSLGQRASEAFPQEGDVRERLEALGRHLSTTEGFTGDTDAYDDPRNSYLNDVLDRKKGVPISLSILYKEVAARCGLPLEGIGLPGHFILACPGQAEAVFLDPFHGGRLLSRADCEELVHTRYQGRVPFREEYLYPYDKKQMLVRLLTNLKRIYFEAKDYPRALSAADRIAIIDPNLDVNIRERARLHYLMGQYREAIRSLELYLKLFPRADDKEKVQGEIAALWSLIASLS
ncbi:MAG: transglutaminase family protein [Chloroflexi bacterium]|nr:transglutaminase family protein [Chloroflexota bacterium]